MFKWLVKQFTSPDEDLDSLGSDVGLRNFLDALPVTVPARTLEAIGEQFEHAPALEIAPERLRHALKALDERAQEPLAAISATLITDANDRDVSDQAWLALSRYFRNLHVGYRVCLEGLNDPGEREKPNAHTDAVLIACRACAALARFKALMRMRYRDVEASYWDNLLGLCAWSMQLGTSSTLVEPYPRCGYQTSVERELLVALLMEAAPLPNLLPPQIAALDGVLRRYAALYHFDELPRDSAPFVLEPGGAPVVRRWMKGLKPRPGMRFFGIGTAYAKLAGLKKEMSAAGEVPEWLGSIRIGKRDYTVLLDLLLSHWSFEPPQRQQRRERVAGEMLVTHGVAQVRRMIAASEYAKAGGQLSYENNTPYDHKLFSRVRFGSLAGEPGQPESAATQAPVTPMETLQKFELEGDRQMTERWAIYDISDSGLSALATTHGGWSRAGMLLGYRPIDSLDWQMGIIRRVNRSSKGRLSVGMQKLAANAVCARVRVGSADEGNAWVAVAGTTDVHHDAILLRSEAGCSVLLAPGTFTGELDCAIAFEKRWHPARLLKVIESGYDYERVTVSLMPPGR